jgi:hypothetical protein
VAKLSALLAFTGATFALCLAALTSSGASTAGLLTVTATVPICGTALAVFLSRNYPPPGGFALRPYDRDRVRGRNLPRGLATRYRTRVDVERLLLRHAKGICPERRSSTCLSKLSSLVFRTRGRARVRVVRKRRRVGYASYRFCVVIGVN